MPIKTAIEHAKHIPGAVKGAGDVLAAGTGGMFFLQYVVEIIDKLVNPLLATISIIMSIIWTYYRIQEMRRKK